jgi:hypothetical protein
MIRLSREIELRTGVPPAVPSPPSQEDIDRETRCKATVADWVKAALTDVLSLRNERTFNGESLAKLRHVRRSSRLQKAMIQNTARRFYAKFPGWEINMARATVQTEMKHALEGVIRGMRRTRPPPPVHNLVTTASLLDA